MTNKQEISAQHPDWSREQKSLFEWNPGGSLLASIRSYQARSKKRGPISFFLLRLASIRHYFWSIISGAEIPLTTNIGGGLIIPHTNGIVIHPDVEIGPNCLICQQVTIGANTIGIPKIGGHTDIGAGAKIIGKISIGDHVRVGVNAVVISDIPDGATVVSPIATILSNNNTPG